MFDLLKLTLLACGGVALYGLVTGQDLNELFQQAGEVVIPAAEAMIQGIKNFILETISK